MRAFVADSVLSGLMSAVAPEPDDPTRALVEVGTWLRGQGYAFTTITPESHRRVNARAPAEARTLRDVFGWSRPFRAGLLPDHVVRSLAAAKVLDDGDLLRTHVRFSTLGDHLFVHSAYPTTGDDAVFFGPDTYRFARFVASAIGSARLLVDVGAGSGAGAISVARCAERIVLADINTRALAYARVNAALAGIADRTEVVASDLYAHVVGEPDVIIANPPYLVDASHRRYRDGGAALGTALGLRMVTEGLARLAPGGRFLLYTGAPIIDGRDLVREALAALPDVSLHYEELDPDVFGEELDTESYRTVDRIAAVGAVLARKR